MKTLEEKTRFRPGVWVSEFQMGVVSALFGAGVLMPGEGLWGRALDKIPEEVAGALIALCGLMTLLGHAMDQYQDRHHSLRLGVRILAGTLWMIFGGVVFADGIADGEIRPIAIIYFWMGTFSFRAIFHEQIHKVVVAKGLRSAPSTMLGTDLRPREQ